MIDPGRIPQFTGDLAQLEKDYGDLKSDASQVRSTGRDVHAGFQGLSAYYSAPEAERLFATTRPVAERADGFADDLESVSSALSSYAAEIRPLVARLEQLKLDAAVFVDSVRGDDEWEYDGDKVDPHNQLRDDVTAAVAAFWAAERTCHNKITALFGGTQMVAGDGSERADQYGFSAGDMKDAKLPWGDPVEERHHWYEVGHWVKSFVWDGLIVDGVWGTIKGLGMLVGCGGWEAMGRAWKGLAQLATGLVVSSMPGAGVLFWSLPDDKLPSWLGDSRTAMKETGKALVAWDEWGKNPARAAGAVTFNVLTTVFTGGAGGAASGAGKAGAVAKALSLAGRAGKVIDPMTYVSKAAGAGLSKIGDISKALKGIGNVEIPKLPDNAITLPEGALKLPDGTVHLPEGSVIPEGAVKLPDGSFQLPHDVPVLPEGSMKLPTEHGAPAQYMAPHGNILDEHGDVLQKAEDGPGDIVDQPDLGDPHAGSDVPHTPSPVKEPALVGAGTHTAEQAGQHIRLSDSLGHDLGDVGRTGDNAAVHAGGDMPTVHAGGENVPAVHAGDHLPGAHAGDHLPGGHAPDNVPTNSLDTHTPARASDNAIPTTADDHLPGGHGHEPGTGGSGHDLPGGGTDTLPGHGHGVPPGRGPLDDLGHAADDAAGDMGGAGEHTPGGHNPGDEAPAAHDGPEDPAHMSPERKLEIMQEQVARANHDPDYFKEFYKSNGNRKSVEIPDHTGLVPPQLVKDVNTGEWMAAKDAPEPLKPDYLEDPVVRGREHITPEGLKTLDDAAAHRHQAVNYDQAAGRHKAEAVQAHHDAPNPETELTRTERSYEYKAAHRDMGDSAEAYGESIAEHHVIPEHYPHATREPLDGPLNGNDQFDQVWRRDDGGYVVVEAKSSVDTELGARNLPNGERVSQGTRKYFDDILREMRERGRYNPKEMDLADELEHALLNDKLDYIVVKGNRNVGEYAGYTMSKFDIR